MIDPRWAERLRWPVATTLVGVGFAIPMVAGGADAAVAALGLVASVTGRVVHRRREPRPQFAGAWRLANAAVLVCFEE